jgi:hypothetical protein
VVKRQICSREGAARISAGTPAVLTEDCRGSLHSVQAGARIVPQLSHRRFLPKSSQFISHPIIQRYIVKLVKAF